MLYLDKILAQLAYTLGFFHQPGVVFALLLFGLRRRRWGATILTITRKCTEGIFCHRQLMR